MTDLAQMSNPTRESSKSYDLTIIAACAAVAIALCFVLAIYSDPSNLVPPDPVLTSFYP